MLINDKNKLRKFYRFIRNSVCKTQKADFDRRIFVRLINSEIYVKSDLIMIYVSFGSEADTRDIIDYSFSCSKKVAVPYCSGNKMLFYEIKSLNELKIGKFGIPTVDTGNNLPVENFDNALCIVPGLCFDSKGNRIGYGGGYYDRFLSEHNVCTVGLTYEICLCNHIPFEQFDVSVDVIITENYFRNSEKEVSTYE